MLKSICCRSSLTLWYCQIGKPRIFRALLSDHKNIGEK